MLEPQHPQEKPFKKTVTFHEDKKNRLLYEMIYRGPASEVYQDLEDLFFLRYDPKTDKATLVKKVDNIPIFCPELKDEESTISTKAVLFCSSADEYGDDKILFQSIKDFISQYVTLDPESLALAAIYVFVTWIYPRFSVVPYFRTMGTQGTGKTKLIKTIGMICYRPMMSNGASSEAGIFRAIQQYGGTLLLDEAEFGKGEQSQAIIKILNAGNTTDASTLRCEPMGKTGEFKLKAFKIFGPKLFSQRKPFDDKSTESRCFTVNMKPNQRGKGIPIDFHLHTKKDAELLRNQLLLWRFRNWYKYPLNASEFNDWEPKGIEDRVLQIAFPALMLAHDKPFMKDDLLKALAGAEEDLTIDRQNMDTCQLLSLLVVLKEEVGVHNLYVKKLTEKFNQEIDLKSERAMSPNRCSWLIRKIFCLKTRHTRDGSLIVWNDAAIKSQLTLYKLSENDEYRDDETPPEPTTDRHMEVNGRFIKIFPS